MHTYCRLIGCNNLSFPGKACCCKQHRDQVPNCSLNKCFNAVEISINKGIEYYEKRCYIHGGRTHFDYEKQIYELKPFANWVTMGVSPRNTK